jgi:hypothetical protein
MRVEHDGMIILFYPHCCITSLSIERFFFLDQINDMARKKKFLKPPWVWKKRG